MNEIIESNFDDDTLSSLILDIVMDGFKKDWENDDDQYWKSFLDKI